MSSQRSRSRGRSPEGNPHPSTAKGFGKSRCRRSRRGGRRLRRHRRAHGDSWTEKFRPQTLTARGPWGPCSRGRKEGGLVSGVPDYRRKGSRCDTGGPSVQKRGKCGRNSGNLPVSEVRTKGPSGGCFEQLREGSKLMCLRNPAFCQCGREALFTLGAPEKESLLHLQDGLFIHVGRRRHA